jgi:hypothetical protein
MDKKLEDALRLIVKTMKKQYKQNEPFTYVESTHELYIKCDTVNIFDVTNIRLICKYDSCFVNPLSYEIYLYVENLQNEPQLPKYDKGFFKNMNELKKIVQEYLDYYTENKNSLYPRKDCDYSYDYDDY